MIAGRQVCALILLAGCPASEEDAQDASVVEELDAGVPLDAARPIVWREASVPDAAVVDATVLTITAPSASIEAWRSYTRAPKYEVSGADVRVPMRDGAKLACTLNRPGSLFGPEEGRFPGLVVELTPYLLYGPSLNDEAGFFTRRGYNTLLCTVRGIGGSEGTWQGAGASQDRRDAHDLVEWLATQPFSDGRIGQFGESYGGQTTYGAASERPPHLRAIAPMQPPHDLYQDVNYPGGVETTRDGKINNWPPIAEFLSLGAISATKEYDTWQSHPTYDAYWQERVPDITKVQVPTLTIGGWVDGYFRSGTYRDIELAPERTWVFYGQWEHFPPVDLDTCGGIVPCVALPLPSGVLLAWFDRWVMELPNTPIPASPTYLSEEGPRATTPLWRELSAWGGAPVETWDLALNGSFRGDEALTFSSKLERDRVLFGRAVLRVRARLDASDANFYVQLLDGDQVVNDGFLRASHRSSSEAPQPPAAVSDYEIAIRPQHYRFAAGHELVLRLSAGPADTVVPIAPVTVTVESATLQLPLLP